MNCAASLRRILESPGLLVAPGATDALTARIIEDLGFKSVYLTGGGIANSLGYPDIGLITMSEILERARIISNSVNIPVVADIDTGYGNPVNVIRAVKEFMAAGVAAVQIEDQITPKKCGHFDEKSVISAREMVLKIRAAIDARGDDELVIIARTDSRESMGLEEAMSRGETYAKAGADLIFVEAPKTVEELKKIAGSDFATVANMVEGGKTPMLPAKDLEAMGFKMVIYANTALRAAGFAVREALGTLLREGDTTSIQDQILTWDERQNLARYPEFKELERKYSLQASDK